MSKEEKAPQMRSGLRKPDTASPSAKTVGPLAVASQRDAKAMPLAHYLSIGLIGLVWLACWTLVRSFFSDAVPSPIDVLHAFYDLLFGAQLVQSILSSLGRIAIGFGIAVFTAVPAGLLMGLSRGLRESVDPLVQLIRPISAVAWIPFAILWFGVTNKAAYFIIAYGAFFPILLNTISSVRDLPAAYTQAAQTLGAKRPLILAHVILPAALPMIFVGLRVGLGNAFAVMVAAELAIGFVLQSGLGYMLIQNSIEGFQPSALLAVICVIGFLGYASDRLLRALQSRITLWETNTA